MFKLFKKRTIVHFCCDKCAWRYDGVDGAQALANHLWEAHRRPAHIEIGGHIFESGPKNPFLRIIAKLRHS